MLKLLWLVGLQQEVDELLLSITSCPIIIILENNLSYCLQKKKFSNFDHRYNVSPIHLLALLVVRNVMKLVRVWVECLWSGSRLQNFEYQWSKAVPWLRSLVASLSPRRPRFAPGSIHEEFMVYKMALGQVFSEFFDFLLSISFHRRSPNSYHLGNA
jgi:hypothetical protein